MEQLLIHLGQPQCCLMATPLMAGVSRGRGVPSGAGAQRSPLLPAISSSQLGFPIPGGMGWGRAGKNPLEDHLGP